MSPRRHARSSRRTETVLTCFNGVSVHHKVVPAREMLFPLTRCSWLAAALVVPYKSGNEPCQESRYESGEQGIPHGGRRRAADRDRRARRRLLLGRGGDFAGRA